METRTLFILSVLILSGFLSKAIAGTSIYKHVDKDGRITFTNRPVANAHKISIAPFSRDTDPKKPGVQPGSPHIQDNTQKERNVMRRQILEKELMTEEKLLADTQNFLAQIRNNGEVSNYQEKIVQLTNKLFLHQRNISALKKELAN